MCRAVRSINRGALLLRRLIAACDVLYRRVVVSLARLHGISSSVTRDYIDVAVDGFVFRMVLFYPRQLLLVEVR